MNLDFLSLKSVGGEFSKIETALSAQKLSHSKGRELPAVSVSKLTEGAKHHIASFLFGTRLYVVADKLAARNAVDKLNGMKANSAVYVCESDDTLLNCKNLSQRALSERLNALARLAEGSAEVAVVTADGLLQKYPSPTLFLDFCVRLARDMEIEPQTVADELGKGGYIRVDNVGEEGEFALRGDILDVYPVGRDKPLRVNFFDDLIENIKTFDLQTMLSEDEVESVLIPPSSDILVDENSLRALVGKSVSDGISLQAASAFRELSARASVGACAPELVWLRPFLSSAQASIFDFFPPSSIVIFDEPKVIWEKLDLCLKEHESRVQSLLNAGEITAQHKKSIFDLNSILKRTEEFRLLSLSTFNISNPIFQPTATFSPTCRPVTKYYLDSETLIADLKVYLINGFKVVLCARSEESEKAVFEHLRDSGAAVTTEGLPEFKKVLLTALPLENGFLYPEQKILVVGAAELVGKRHDFGRIAQKATVMDIKEGDYVVHSVHGIGVCEGTTRMKLGEFEKEFIVLRYLNDDILYVATDQMDNLHKFVGEENPPLNRLGGKDFQRDKEKVKKSIKKLAIDLLKLYSEREKIKGFAYARDTEWQKEFEDAFPFDETPDQLSAINTIKGEMESGKVVDRLLCGDVGFGKTEVAFRIIFKTILDNKQAVLLAPTTVLCKQHFELLRDRLKPFGVEVGMLSRLQTKDENEKTLQGLADGTIFVVVATHRVLSKDVNFSDLGLLVLDEEQRFGVEHKEKIKEKYPTVNVLTLSATPIPRTLNMSLTGVRDISMLETAPKGRLPVQTYVVEYTDALIVDAITREVARGGQVLILFNSVEHIVTFKQELQSKLPDAVRLTYAHGQMSPMELERRMTEFYEKKYDVLIATTIIENGIDLPDANTLIVVDSEHFGLSQLYQLRGRVGRRGVLAHAYFTVPRSGDMNETAQKRLNALLENTEIGSGFKVAVADLSIRGAGSILGAEQHGHIERVGYEMYLELLNRTVEELRTGRVLDEREIDFKVDASTYIRNDYVSARDKLRIYKRISAICTLSDRDALVKELTEVYGDVDAPLRNLMGIALIKNLARGLDVKSVVVNKKGVGVNFLSDEVFGNQELLKVVADHPKDVVLTSTLPPSLVFNAVRLTPEEKIELLVRFFAEVKK